MQIARILKVLVIMMMMGNRKPTILLVNGWMPLKNDLAVFLTLFKKGSNPGSYRPLA